MLVVVAIGISQKCIFALKIVFGENIPTGHHLNVKTLNIFKGVLSPYFECKEIKENIINFRGFKMDIVSCFFLSSSLGIYLSELGKQRHSNGTLQYKNTGGRSGLVVRASDSRSGDPGSILGRVGVLFP